MYQKYVKRILDIIVVLILSIVAIPVIIITIILIKIFDKGPAVFCQERTGINGKNFKIYKFRTMCVKVYDENGNKLDHDKRLTNIGKVLRKTSIDELPQLLNILKGEMSFIGPRPWIPEYYASFNEEQKNRTNVLPGITGLAQANGRNGLDIFKKLEYDIEYVNNVTFLQDIKIIFMTLNIITKSQHSEIIQEDIREEINSLKRCNGLAEDYI